MAAHISRRSQAVTLVTRRAEHALAIQLSRENREYLPGVKLPETLAVTSDLRAALLDAYVVLFASPSHALRTWCEHVRDALPGEHSVQLAVSLVKGLELDSHLRPSEIMAQVLPDINVATLTGPTNAAEVARGLPSAMVLAAARPGAFVDRVQALISGSTLRVYTSDDLPGAEFGACLKNIYAIAAGLCDGLKLGDNAKAALLTRALAEMVRVGATLGAQRETFYGLSGFGDLVATCHGSWSRNREFGQRIGEGKSVEELLEGRRTVVEGHRSTQSFHELCHAKGITAPIMSEMEAILYHSRKPADALMALMTRELKRESR